MIPPNGQDALSVREAYLHQRHQQRRIGDRGWRVMWFLLAVAGVWLFIAAFAGLGH